MNNNSTHKEIKNFALKVSDFFYILTGLPAGPWFAVNFLLAQYRNLRSLPAISNSIISKFLKDSKSELKLKPVFVMNELCSYK